MSRIRHVGGGSRPASGTKRLAIVVAAAVGLGSFVLLPGGPETAVPEAMASRGADRFREPVGVPPSEASAAAGARRLDVASTGAAVQSGRGGAQEAQKVVTGPAIDLRAVMEQVHFAFRPKDGAWRGGHTTYEVAVERGELVVTPYHHPNRRPQGDAGAKAGRATDPMPTDEVASRARAASDVLEGSAVRFSASRVARGGSVLAEGEGIASTNAKGQLEIEKGSVTERLVNGPSGVEQTWSFVERPEGAGDLEVRVAVLGAEFLGETEGGLHLTGGKLGVRYGHGTWIDRLGNATAVPARWDGGAIVLTVPVSILEGSLYPAVLDPIISPELGIDAPVYGPPKGIQSSPAVAWDGTNHLVVWEDGRDTYSAIYGARLSAAGAVQDPGGIIISASAFSAVNPAVAWDGTNHLVVWEEYRVATQDVDIFGARVSAAGVVQDPGGIAVSTALGTQRDPAVSFDGSNHLVVWEDDRDSTNVDIYGARVSAAGAVQDADGIRITTAVGIQSGPAVSWNGTNHLVVWHDHRSGNDSDVYGARVTPNGVVHDPSGFVIAAAPGYQSWPAVSWDGANHLVVWHNTTSYFDTDANVYGARVSAEGVVHGAIAISAAAGNQSYPAVSWDGTNHLVVWADSRNSSASDIYAARVSPVGSVLDPGGLAISTAPGLQETPAISWDGANHLVVWQDSRVGSGTDIYGARVSGAGVVQDGEGVLVSVAPNQQLAPALSWNGTTYLVAWSEYRAATGWDIYGARLSALGEMEDPAGIAISTFARSQSVPAVSWDGTNHLVVWQDDRKGMGGAVSDDIYGARVSAAGVVHDPAGFGISVVAGYQQTPAVSWDGTNHLVLWQQLVPGGSMDVYGARVSAGGVVQDPTAIGIATTSRNEQAPAASWDGTSHLVVWEEQHNSTGYDVYGARVSAAGEVRDPTAFAISTAAGDQRWPALSWDGANHFVVWTDRRDGTASDIYGARVSDAAVVQDAAGIAISTAENDQQNASIAWDGTSQLVVWQDSRSGIAYDIYGARVSAAGVVHETEGFLVSSAPFDERWPAVSSSAPYHFLIVYEGADPRPSVGDRILARAVQFVTPPTASDLDATLAEDAPTPIALLASDGDGDVLTWIVDSPSHGTLSGTAPNLIYTPAAEFSGADAFTFRVNDGAYDSNVATVSITVTPVNDAPVALPQSVTLAEDTAQGVTLAATDVEGTPLTWAVVDPPRHGTLSGTAPDLTYVPAADFNGSDTFTFKVNDGAVDSNVAAVTITVTPVNDGGPVAQSQSITTAEDTSTAVTLAATDVDGDPLTWTVVAQPAHGTLWGTVPNLTYTPAADFDGSDAFTFVASDGLLDSNATTVSLTVTAVNDAPVAQALSGATAEDTPVAVALAATDVDGDPLTWTVVVPPAHGTLSGTTPDLTYVPDADFNGTDAFMFRASDGAMDSDLATVSIAVSPVNDAPIAYDHEVTTPYRTASAMTLTATDVDADTLTWAIVVQPAHGTLSGAAPDITYTPDPGFSGTDTFTFEVDDGTVRSAPAAVSVTVTPAPTSPGSPSGGGGCATGSGATPASALALLLLALRPRRRAGPAARGRAR
jgi:hypothetical protein